LYPSNSVQAYGQFAGYDEQLLVEVTSADIQSGQWTLFSAIITPPQQTTAATIPVTIRFSARNDANED